MKRMILFVVFMCGVLSLFAQNTVDTTDQVVLKYSLDSIVTGGGAEYSQTEYTQGAAIRYTENQLKLYAGNYVVKMSVGLAKEDKWIPEHVSSLTYWIRKSLNGENVWEQEFDTKNIVFGAWNELVFDEFYAIDATSDLYFGYTINCGGLPIGADGNSMSPNPNATYIYDSSEAKWIQHSQLGNFTIKVTVAGENMPKNNIAINALRTAEFVRPDSKFDAILNISNTLDNLVTSFDLVVYDGENELTRKTVSLDKALKNGESLNVFVEGIQLTEEGIFDAIYMIDNINGEDKDDNDLDSKIVKKTYVSNDFDDKVLMLEMFSGTRCGACPTGHSHVHNALHNLGEEKYVWATHHTSYNQSELTVNSATDLNYFYQSPTFYAPAVMLDRLNLLEFGVPSNGGSGPVFSLNEFASEGQFEPLLKSLQTNMSPIGLDVHYELNETTRELYVKLEGELLGDFEAKGLRVGVMTIEDNILGTQTGMAGKYNHTHIVRSFFTSVYGDYTSVSNGAFTMEFVDVLKDKFVLDNMRLAVWVGKNASTSNVNGFDIYQAYEVKLTDRPYTAVEYVSDNSQLVVYQEDESLFVEGVEVGDVLSIYSMEGKLVMQSIVDTEKTELNLTGLAKGTYLLQTNGSYVKFVK
jgi:hypothetical protein